MPFKIVRNDITKMNTEAVVNTANERAVVDTGCDSAIYAAAGYDELLVYRREHIGDVPAGEAFITPGFNLKAEYIIHAVSPLYIDGESGEEEKLRNCYRKALSLADEKGIRSIAFPLISTGGFGYPKEEGMRIALDEIQAFLEDHRMMIYLVVFDEKSASLGRRAYPGLEEYIDRNYVEQASDAEYNSSYSKASRNRLSLGQMLKMGISRSEKASARPREEAARPQGEAARPRREESSRPRKEERPVYSDSLMYEAAEDTCVDEEVFASADMDLCDAAASFEEKHESRLEERMRHLSDTFSEYLLYLIHDKNMENAEVYKRAIVDKKTFSKIKNNVDYHPQKLTALCLCVGARLNLDESKDLLARAGYALSPCDKTDIIFSYFIENEIYDMIELDIQLEEHGLPCIIA